MRRPPFLFVAAALIAIIAAVPVASAAINRGPGLTPEARVSALVALGNGFTYQGRLTDAGAPANATYDMRFILFDAESGGAQVGATIEKADIQVQNGLFTTELDFGAAPFDGNARWLEIAIRPGNQSGSYTVLSPRQPITPVPYALYAKSAGIALPFTGTLTSATGGVIDINQGGVGIAIQADRTSTGGETNPSILGTNSGSGPGVMGLTTYDADASAVGVTGDATGATTGTGGVFRGPTAVSLEGAVRVAGDAGERAAFSITADSADFCDGAMPIDNAMTNADPTAMLFVTVQGATPAAVSVGYDVDPACDDQWVVYGLADGVTANVLVIKQ